MASGSGSSDIGFGGLRAFATNIDGALSAADELVRTPTDAPAPHAPVEPGTVDRDLGALAGVGRLLKTVVGIAAALAVVFVIRALIHEGIEGSRSASSDDYSSTYSDAYEPSIDSNMSMDADTTAYDDMSMDANMTAGANMEVSPPVDLPAPSSSDTWTYQPPSASEDVDASDEQRPSPADLGTSYNAAQVRYCVAEDIRINGAKEYADGLSISDPDAFNRTVEPFNEMVNDYNARCSRYYYDRPQMATIRNSVDARRTSLEAEGRRRLQ